jgi:isoleucyl-tRNA synthetase
MTSGPRPPTPDPYGTAPYRAVVVNDLVLDAEGQKMSKHRGNVVDPWEVIAEHGADAVRVFLVGSSQVWLPRRFDRQGIRDVAGRFLLTLKNTYSGIFAQYANFGWAPTRLDPPAARRPAIDRWVLSRLAAVEAHVDALLERYEATQALTEIIKFVDADVSNWYVRLSRNLGRFYEVDGEDNRAAFATLHEVLVVACRLLAPFAPFVSDWMHRELTGGSVHLAPFVRAARPPDPELERAMDGVRRLATLGRAAREEAGGPARKVRQPLARVVCVVPFQPPPAMAELVPLLAAELNVKRVEFASSADRLVTLEAKPNHRALGRRFGKLTPLAAEAVRALSSDALRALERGDPVAISVGGESHSLSLDDVTILRRASGDLVVREDDGYFAAVDPALTPALRREGAARELVRAVNDLRKRAGFAVSDRVVLAVDGDAEVLAAVREHERWVAGEVLALRLIVGEVAGTYQATDAFTLDGWSARVAISRIA